MKQIDLEPTKYRKQDRSGRWIENVDRPLARLMAAGGTAFMLYFAWHYREEAPISALLFFLCMGIAIGALIMMSLKPSDR